MVTIVEDTRNQVNKHEAKNSYFEAQGINVMRSKLPVGDYARLDNMAVVIDTKKDILELASNICSSQHARFRQECLRAKNNGIRLIILVEEGNYSLETLHMWSSPVKKYGKGRGMPLTNIKGETLQKACYTMQDKYGIQIIFCHRERSAEMILRLLGIRE